MDIHIGRDGIQIDRVDEETNSEHSFIDKAQDDQERFTSLQKTNYDNTTPKASGSKKQRSRNGNNSKLQKQLEEAHGEIDALKKMLSIIRKDLNEKTFEIEALKTEKQQFSSHLNSTDGGNSFASDEAREQLELEKESLLRTKSELESLQARLRDENEERYMMHAEDLRATQEERDRANKSYNDLNSIYTELLEKFYVFEQENQDLQHQLEVQRRENFELQKSASKLHTPSSDANKPISDILQQVQSQDELASESTGDVQEGQSQAQEQLTKNSNGQGKMQSKKASKSISRNLRKFKGRALVYVKKTNQALVNSKNSESRSQRSRDKSDDHSRVSESTEEASIGDQTMEQEPNQLKTSRTISKHEFNVLKAHYDDLKSELFRVCHTSRQEEEELRSQISNLTDEKYRVEVALEDSNQKTDEALAQLARMEFRLAQILNEDEWQEHELARQVNELSIQKRNVEKYIDCLERQNKALADVADELQQKLLNTDDGFYGRREAQSAPLKSDQTSSKMSDVDRDHKIQELQGKLLEEESRTELLLNELSNQKAAMESALNEARGACFNFERQIEQLEEELQSTQTQLWQATDECSNNSSELQKMSMDFESRLSELNNQKETQIQLYKSQLHDAEQKNASLIKENIDLECYVEELYDVEGAYKADLTALQKQLHKLKEQDKAKCRTISRQAENIKELGQLFATLNHEFTTLASESQEMKRSLTRQLEGKSKHCRELQGEVEMERVIQSGLKSSLELAEQDCQKLKSRLQQESDKNSIIQADLRSAIEISIQDYQHACKDRHSLRDEIQRLGNKIEALSNEIKEHVERISTLEAENKEATDNLHEARARKAVQFFESQQRLVKIENLEAELDEQRENYDKVVSENSEQRHSIEVLKKDLSAKDGLLKKISEENSKVKLEFKNLQSKIIELNEKYEQTHPEVREEGTQTIDIDSSREALNKFSSESFNAKPSDREHKDQKDQKEQKEDGSSEDHEDKHSTQWKSTIFKLGGFIKSKITDMPVIHSLVSHHDDKESSSNLHIVNGRVDPKDAIRFYSLAEERTDNFNSMDYILELD